MSPDKPILGRRFIRWASDYPVLKEFSAVAFLRRYTPVPVGSSGATGFSPRGLSPVQQIAPTPMRRFIRCQPDRLVLLHRIIRRHWFLQNLSILFFLVLSSCFAWLGLFASSLGSIIVLLTNSLVSLITLLFYHQNHKIIV